MPGYSTWTRKGKGEALTEIISIDGPQRTSKMAAVWKSYLMELETRRVRQN